MHQVCKSPKIERTHSPRRKCRYLVERPLSLIPVLPGSQPRSDVHLEGFCRDLSTSGVSLEVRADRSHLTQLLVVGVEGDDGAVCYATANLRHATANGPTLQIGVEFVDASQELFRPENLQPQFDPASMWFRTGLPEATLNLWTQVGVTRRITLDWMQVCTRCQSLVTIRRGCPACGSSCIDTSQLIHHFACAHVGFVADFESPDDLVCPKCRTSNLVVGADFETLQGPYGCRDCGWSDTELSQIAQCLHCWHRFPAELSNEKELCGYDVDRLDPLALIGTT